MSLSQPSIDSLSIHRAEIALELITPVFMAGARNILESKKKGIKQDYVPELRAASVRGEMHYWYRAWLGGVVGDNHQELNRRESMVFGSTQMGSSVTIRITNSIKLPFGAGAPAKTTPMLVHGQKERLPVPAFNSGTFKIFISDRFGRNDMVLAANEQIPLLQALQSALWLLVNLGGIGKRSRRGFGSLRYVDEPIYTSAEKLRDGLKEALAFLPQPGQRANFKNGKLPDYPVLHPDYCKIAVCVDVDKFQTYQDAMRAFWNVLRNPPREMIFGYVSGTKRLASPVHLHIAKVKTDGGFRYCPVMTAFRTSAQRFNGESWSMVEQLLRDVAGANNIIYGQGTSW